jgi:tRNA threonylcarbamoyl adenosine modification protein (Sua5/YciO/YrdC/YwlC family)
MLIKIYNDNPNDREVRRAAQAIDAGGVIIVPTDTLYAFVCGINHKQAAEAIARVKGFSLKQAKYSLLCSSLSQLSEYVRPMDRNLFSLLKNSLPGPFTFIMDANNNVPRNYQNQNKTIGLRVPDNNILRAIIDAVGTPLISTSVRLINEEQEKEYLTDPELIHDLLGNRVFMVVDGGIGDAEPSTVVDCSGGNLEIVRQGKGEIAL